MYTNEEDFYGTRARLAVTMWETYRPAVGLLSLMAFAVFVVFGAGAPRVQTLHIAPVALTPSVAVTVPAQAELVATSESAPPKETIHDETLGNEVEISETPPAPTETARTDSVENTICATFGNQCQKALSVAHCESRFVSTAVGGLGERGVFQIHPVHAPKLGPYGGWDAMFNPEANIAFAYDLYSAAGWAPWSCA